MGWDGMGWNGWMGGMDGWMDGWMDGEEKGRRVVHIMFPLDVHAHKAKCLI